MERTPSSLRACSFTFAVIGRNEAERLAGMVGLAREAAEPGDRVWFVDSGSDDDSIAVARGLGAEVIEAPAGKGRAMAVAIERCESRYICFLDGDLFRWTVNVPAALRAATAASGADMVIGVYGDDRRRVIQPYIYWPLVDALFPDYGRQCDPTPLSGLRILNAALVPRPVPAGYGIETYLNLAFAAAGHVIVTEDVGFIRGPLRGYANVPEVSHAVATEILDFAVREGRLDPALRPDWDRWVGEVVDTIGIPPAPGEPGDEHLAAVAAVAARPLPPARRS
jgi:glycosyltransferase involved in cell wall biosynthesis